MTTETEFINTVDPYTDRVISANISPKSLRKLVRKAKQGNERALDRLCSLYLPIVASVYTDSLVKYLLGEDAISIVWEHFLTLINTYQGNDYKRLPGLIKICLLRRIKNDFKDPGSYKEKVVTDSEALEATPRHDKGLSRVHENAGFYSLLKGCTPKQIKVAKLLYMYDLEKSYVARILHEQRSSIEKVNTRLLAKVKDNYYKQKRIDRS